jgi:cytochrome c
MGHKVHLAALLLLSTQFTHTNATDTPRGQDLFRAHCVACHSMRCNKVGPSLEGVIGRNAGTLLDFKDFSPELKASGIVWSETTLDTFLRDPGKMVPGTKMAAAGRLPSAKDRIDLIAYVRSGNTSLDLCF